MKRIIPILTLLLWTTFWFGGASALLAQTQPEAGFCFLEENDFYFHTNSYFNRLALRSSQARIWRVYQPADDDPVSKPLFVFFNGGPGGATSAGLFSANTAVTPFLSTHRQVKVPLSSTHTDGPASVTFSISMPVRQASLTA